jgi:cell division protein FtsX
MTDIELVDVTVHIDKDLNAEARAEVEESLRAMDGVVSVHIADATSHLAVVEYNPQRTNSQDILATVTKLDGHAELVGL